MSITEDLKRAAELIAGANALLIGAGAGMGVDSGLPDFRGNEGFWNAYPPYRNLNCSFYDMASPDWFARDHRFAWGFYGHRRNLYRKTEPHSGFQRLLEWAESKRDGYFVFTSNVDCQFQKAGFAQERIVECHGSIEWNQCLEGCSCEPFPADESLLAIDEETMKARDPLPSCPRCRGRARPNILMFGDWEWDHRRSARQEILLHQWAEGVERNLTVIECGAGTTIPTVRWHCRSAATEGQLIRINPRDSQVPDGHLGIPMGAREALEAIATFL